ncbi:MAG: hypothetical protein NTU77_16025, partial [Actinobacteria bacterium]|nr:hypothetical protein [Actinomycetota bacterium]
PALRRDRHGRCRRWWCAGGIATVGTDRLWEEIGFLAYYLHWSLDDLLDMTHEVRQRMARMVSTFNQA